MTDDALPKVDNGILLTVPCPDCGQWSRLLIEHPGDLMFEVGTCGHRFSKWVVGAAMERLGRELSDTAHGVRRN